MGADIDLNNLHVIKELNTWGKWYLDTTNVDGFRLDAVKHIRSDFFPGWISGLEDYSDKKLFTVGEYWSLDLEKLERYLENTNYTLSLFDVPLHYNFYLASISNGNFDMGGIFNNTLVKNHPNNAVTFVDNHDTEPGQALESFVDLWFKPLAYAMIMFREKSIPCVFYGDYYGIPEKNIPAMKELLDIFFMVRKYMAYGKETTYFCVASGRRMNGKHECDYGFQKLALLYEKSGLGDIKYKSVIVDRYEPAPQNVTEKVVAAAAKDLQDDDED